MKQLQRKLEGVVGGKLVNLASGVLLMDAGLKKREVYLPETGLTVHYYERTARAHESNNKNSSSNSKSIQTLLLFHGITSEAKDLAPLVRVFGREMPHWRIIVPDLIGHGNDLVRAKKEGPGFLYPTPQRLLQCVSELVDILEIQQYHVFGISMGGCLAYYLQQQYPERVQSAILISPALEAVVDPQFITDFVTRKKHHFCYESRDDVKHFFRELSCPHPKVKNPVPKFFLEAIWQDRIARVPQGHFHSYFQILLEARGTDPEWLGCTRDICPDAKRLVIWPQDDFIANHELGKSFFAKSATTTTTFHSIPDCGHLFHSNGKMIMEHVTPIMVDYWKQHDQVPA